MGFLDNLRAAKAMAEAVYDTVPHWARIVEVGGRVGPMIRLKLEIHSYNDPPHVVSSLSWPPRRVQPVAGMDVAFRMSQGQDTTNYEVVWDRPPQYGRPPHGGRPADARPLIEPPR